MNRRLIRKIVDKRQKGFKPAELFDFKNKETNAYLLTPTTSRTIRQLYKKSRRSTKCRCGSVQRIIQDNRKEKQWRVRKTKYEGNILP